MSISDMKIFRKDRVSNIINYGISNVGGGVCIYIGKKFKDFAQLYDDGTSTSIDYEIVSVLINKPHF